MQKPQLFFNIPLLLFLMNCLFSRTFMVEAHKNCFDNERHSCKKNRFPIEDNYFACNIVHTLSIKPTKMAYIDGNLLVKEDDKVYKINANSTHEPYDNVRFPPEAIQHKSTTYGSAKGKAYMNVHIPDELPQVFYITTDGSDGYDEVSLNRKTEKLYIVKTIRNSDGRVQKGSLYVVDINKLRIVNSSVFADKVEVPAIITTATIPLDSNDLIFSVVNGEGAKIVSFKEHKSDPCDTVSKDYAGKLGKFSTDEQTRSLVTIIRENEMKLIDFFEQVRNSTAGNLRRSEGGKNLPGVEIENQRLKRELDVAVKKFDNLRSKLIPLSISNNNKQSKRRMRPENSHKILNSQLPEYSSTPSSIYINTHPRSTPRTISMTTPVPNGITENVQNSLTEKDEELKSCNSMLEEKTSMLRTILESFEDKSE
ncbi:uncharacterized protein LOC143915517 [Arctopsyche grandis]|uniref:uncharacterized protein LOC143915517 n=1 Tax=Arctopsyche grandis TaxID=121162 RepID=UPI00406D83A0